MYNKRIIKSFIITDMGEPIILQPGSDEVLKHDEVPREQVIRKIFQDTISGRQKIERLVQEAKEKAKTILEEAEREKERILKEAENQKQQILNEANLEKENIIKTAEEEVRQLKLQTEREISSIRDQAYNEGFEAGRAEGLKQGIEELNDLRFLVETIIDKLNESKREFLSKVSDDLVEIVFAVVKKVLRREVEEDKTFILRNLEKALEKVSSQEKVRIHINPDEYNIVQEQRDYLESLFKGSINIELIKDKNLDKGDCVIETKYGYIDARIDSQLENIKSELKKEL